MREEGEVGERTSIVRPPPSVRERTEVNGNWPSTVCAEVCIPKDASDRVCQNEHGIQFVQIPTDLGSNEI